jgi:hypothetical protein
LAGEHDIAVVGVMLIPARQAPRAGYFRRLA